MKMKWTKSLEQKAIEAAASRQLNITFTDASSNETKARFLGKFLAEGFVLDPEAVNSVTFNAIYMNEICKRYRELGFKKIPGVIDVDPTGEAVKVLPLITGENEIPSVNYSIPLEWNLGNAMGALPLALNIFALIRTVEDKLRSGDGWKENAVSILKEEMCTNTIFERKRLQNKIEDDGIQFLLDQYDKYMEILAKEGLISFADQEPMALRMFKEHPEDLNLGVNHVLVDEFQDSNEANMEFIRMISNRPEMKDILAIGDEKQGIYAFRGAVVENFSQFESRVQTPGEPAKEVKRMNLSANYRSYDEIIDPANALVALNKSATVSPIKAMRGKGGEFHLKGFYNSDDELKYIVDEIKNLIDSGRYTASDIYVLIRTKKPVPKVQAALTKAGIQTSILCGVKVIEDSRVRAALDLTDAFYDPDATKLYRNYINAVCEETYQKSIKDVYDNDEGREALDEAIADLKKKFTDADDKDAGYLLSTYHDLLEQINHGEIYSRWLELVYDAGKKACIGISDEEDKAEAMLAAELQFIRNFRRFGKDTEFKYNEEYDGVGIGTAHSSKGLERPVVFVMETEFDNEPSHKMKFPEAERDETRRLLFVSMTRAKDILYVTGQFLIKRGKDKDGNPVILENQYLHELFSVSGMDSEWIPIDPDEEKKLAEKKKAQAEKARIQRIQKSLAAKAITAGKRNGFGQSTKISAPRKSVKKSAKSRG